MKFQPIVNEQTSKISDFLSHKLNGGRGNIFQYLKMPPLNSHQWHSPNTMGSVISLFDDYLGPMDECNDYDWGGYEIPEDFARDVTIRAIMGGSSVGRQRPYIDELEAGKIWLLFRDLFHGDCHFYGGLALGESENFTCTEGCVIVTRETAGVLYILDYY